MVEPDTHTIIRRRRRPFRRELGLYIPSAFKIVIEDNLSFLKFEDRHWSIFAHEYIHFLQDITTVYGANNIYYLSELLKSAHSAQRSSKDRTLTVPYVPDIDDGDNVFANMEISEYTFGSIEEIPIIVSIVGYTSSTDEISSDRVREIPSAIFSVQDTDGHEYNINFGANAIMESMAYLFERHTAPEELPPPSDYPYRFAERVVEYMYPEFGKNDLNVLALCDLSLQMSNPGPTFVYFLNKMNEEKYLPNEPEDLYERYYNTKVETLGHCEEVVTFSENIEEYIRRAETSMKDYFHDIHFSSVIDWISATFTKCIELRLKYPLFLLEMARGGNIRTNRCCSYLLNEHIGAPIVVNGFGQFSSKIPGKKTNGELLLFAAIGEIANLILTGNTNCSLYPVCSLLTDTKCCEQCKVEPWLHWETITDNCPYATMWKHWGFTGCKPSVWTNCSRRRQKEAHLENNTIVGIDVKYAVSFSFATIIVQGMMLKS